MAERPMPHVEGVEHRYADVGGVRLHYAEAGPADGEPVVLVHGWPQHWYAWRRVIPLLAGRFRVLVPDLRGFGWSDAPPSTYEKAELGHDIAGLLDGLDLSGVRLAGHDWGGAAAFRAALEVPGRLRSLAAIAIIHPWARGKPSPMGVLAMMAYQPAIAMPFLGKALQRYTPFVHGPLLISGGSRIWTGLERESFAAQFREPDRAEAASRVYRSFLLKEARQRRPDERLRVPARLLLGSRDPICTPGINAGAEEAGIEVEVVEGAGHWLPETHPDLVAERIAGEPR